MNNEECFAAWAPDAVPWSQWAKPSLFIQFAPAIPRGGEESQWASKDVSWVPDARGQGALVIELPGAESVIMGVALARRGYRPIPLFNTCIGPSAVVPTEGIASLLEAGAREMGTLRLPVDAPPAFLLDSQRMRPPVAPSPGKLDNRWVVFPQDFPSANYLRSRGIGEVVLIHDAAAVQDDLAHVLLRWQQGGLQLLAIDAKERGRPRELVVRMPSLFRRAWYRALAIAGLRRNDAGGFGSVIPVIVHGGSFG